MEEDWLKNLTNIKDRADYLLSNEKCSDCHFRVGTGKEKRVFSCRKLTLATASPEFKRMFYESPPATASPIFVEDIEPATFKELLVYIYSGTFKMHSIKSAFDLYYAAKKYLL